MNATFENFLRHLKYEKNYSELTIESYRRDLCQYEHFVDETKEQGLPIEDELDLARAWMSDMGRRRLAVSTIKRRLCALRSYYRYLQQKHLSDRDPLDLLASPRVSKPLPVWVREEQMEYLLDGVDYGDGFIAMRDRLVIDLLYSTGMRRAEAARLRDDDIDFGNQVFRVIGKGNRQRIIPFGRELEVLMKDYIRERDRKFGPVAETFLVRKNGFSLEPRHLYQIAKKYLGFLPSLSKKSTHVLRHTFATNMLNNGADLMAVKELLGHRTLQSTEVYTHISPSEIIANYNQAHPRAATDKKQ